MPAVDQITQVRLYHCSQPISVSYSSDTRSTMDVLIVEISTAHHTGWGEVLMPRVKPLWDWAKKVAPLNIGGHASSLDALLENWPSDRPQMSLQECGTYCHPEVDCVGEAFSIALHDLHAKHEVVRFADLLGTVARTHIPGMPTITLGSTTDMINEALDWQTLGVKHLKLKLSGDSSRDVSIIQKIRQTLGNEVDLQVDANGAYDTIESARDIITALNDAKISVIEDLFRIDNEDCVRTARELLTGRTMLDKACYWPHVKQTLRSGLVDLINQHPHNQGSMTNALKIAQAAKDSGVENAIGSSGILGIQNTAFLHLAAVTALTRPCEDIGLHNYYDHPIRSLLRFDSRPTVVSNPVIMHKGILTLPSDPGLGIEIDRDALRRLTQHASTYTSRPS